jgi:hypothetical protein
VGSLCPLPQGPIVFEDVRRDRPIALHPLARPVLEGLHARRLEARTIPVIDLQIEPPVVDDTDDEVVEVQTGAAEELPNVHDSEWTQRFDEPSAEAVDGLGSGVGIDSSGHGAASSAPEV